MPSQRPAAWCCPLRWLSLRFIRSELDAAIRAVRRKAGIDENYLYPFELYWEINDPAVKTEFLTAQPARPINLDTMLNHLDYVAERIGVDTSASVQTLTTAAASTAIRMQATR